MSIVETASYKSLDKAVRIEKMEISDDYFDTKDALPKSFFEPFFGGFEAFGWDVCLKGASAG